MSPLNPIKYHIFRQYSQYQSCPLKYHIFRHGNQDQSSPLKYHIFRQFSKISFVHKNITFEDWYLDYSELSHVIDDLSPYLEPGQMSDKWQWPWEHIQYQHFNMKTHLGSFRLILNFVVTKVTWGVGETVCSSTSVLNDQILFIRSVETHGKISYFHL